MDCEVRERRQDEQALAHRWVRDLEQARRGARVDACRRGPALGWALDADALPAEHEQVEVELARPPAIPLAAAERPLDPLERHEQGDGADLGVGAGRRVERHDRVQEVRLVGDADGLRSIEARDASEMRAWQGGQRRHGGGQRLPSHRRRSPPARCTPASLRKLNLRQRAARVAACSPCRRPNPAPGGAPGLCRARRHSCDCPKEERRSACEAVPRGWRSRRPRGRSACRTAGHSVSGFASSPPT